MSPTDEVCSGACLGLFESIELISSLGGRTAWSSRVTVNGIEIQGRFWYDLQYIERAREDAAEMALRYLTGTSNISVDPPPASFFARS